MNHKKSETGLSYSKSSQTDSIIQAPLSLTLKRVLYVRFARTLNSILFTNSTSITHRTSGTQNETPLYSTPRSQRTSGICSIHSTPSARRNESMSSKICCSMKSLYRTVARLRTTSVTTKTDTGMPSLRLIKTERQQEDVFKCGTNTCQI